MKRGCRSQIEPFRLTKIGERCSISRRLVVNYGLLERLPTPFHTVSQGKFSETEEDFLEEPTDRL